MCVAGNSSSGVELIRRSWWGFQNTLSCSLNHPLTHNIIGYQGHNPHWLIMVIYHVVGFNTDIWTLSNDTDAPNSIEHPRTLLKYLMILGNE